MANKQIPPQLRLLAVTFLLLTLAPDTILASGQASDDDLSLYGQALFASLERMKGAYRTLRNDFPSEYQTIDYDKMIVEEEPGITTGLPLKRGNTEIEILDWRELSKRSKTAKKKIAILRGAPMTVELNRLKISFAVYWYSYKHKRHTYGLSDWSTVYFRYDCVKQRYFIDEVRLDGI